MINIKCIVCLSYSLIIYLTNGRVITGYYANLTRSETMVRGTEVLFAATIYWVSYQCAMCVHAPHPTTVCHVCACTPPYHSVPCVCMHPTLPQCAMCVHAPHPTTVCHVCACTPPYHSVPCVCACTPPYHSVPRVHAPHPTTVCRVCVHPTLPQCAMCVCACTPPYHSVPCVCVCACTPPYRCVCVVPCVNSSCIVRTT